MAAEFVGRSSETTSVLDAVASGSTCLVTGGAGVGKSRLLHEVGLRLAADGTEVLTISGAEATSVIPLAPLLRLCAPDVADPGASIIAELYRRSRERPVTVVCDDAHRLDEASTAILVQLSNADAFSMVVGVRTGEPAPSGVASLLGADLTTTVMVEPLSRPDTVLLAADMVGGPLGSATEDWMWERSLGHPLYLRELIVSADETGVLTRRNGRWVITDPDIRSSRLRQMIANRLQRLGSDVRLAVDAAAVGVRLHHRVVELAASTAGMQAAIDRGLIEREGGHVVCAHPLYREVATATMSGDDLARVRRALADAADQLPDIDPITRALIRIDSDRPPETPLLVAAYDTAINARRPHLAEDLARRILDREPGRPVGLMALAESLAMQRKWNQAIDFYRSAIDIADDNQVRSFHVRWLQLNFDYQDDVAVVIDEATRIGDEMGGELGASLRYPALRGELFVGNLLEVSDKLVALLDADDTPSEVSSLAMLDLATADGHTGNFSRALRLTTDLLASREGKLPAVEEARTRLSRAWAIGWHSSTIDAIDSTDEFLLEARARGDPDWETLACFGLGFVTSYGHRVGEACKWFKEGLRISAYGRHVRHKPLVTAEYARVRSLLPGVDASIDVANAFRAPEQGRAVAEAIVHLAASRIARRAGADPLPALEAGLMQSRNRGSRTHELFILREHVVCGDPIADLTPEQSANRADEIASYSETRGLAGIYADEIAAAVHRDPAASDAVGVAALEWGAFGIALDSFALAAINHTVSGNLKEALTSELAAGRTAGRIPPQISWPLQRHTPVLTDRERQVADLTAGGLTSRDIAKALYISHRTVDSHLRRIYQRLDLSGRDELTAIMNPDATADRPASQYPQSN